MCRLRAGCCASYCDQQGTPCSAATSPTRLRQASSAKQAAGGAAQRLSQLQERCTTEEARLAALQAAVAEQRQGFDAQVRSLLDMGQQVCAPLGSGAGWGGGWSFCGAEA